VRSRATNRVTESTCLWQSNSPKQGRANFSYVVRKVVQPIAAFAGKTQLTHRQE
jgi:hypothetical protein